MAKAFLHRMVCLWTLIPLSVSAEEKTEKSKEVSAPSFHGDFLGMEVHADRLGVVLDISDSMNRSLPAIREALRQKLPQTPVLHVDGSGLEKPDPRPRVVAGTAPETVTAVAMLGKHAKVNAVLWISDMGDAPNRAGVEAMAEVLSEHGMTLFLLTVKNRPGPSLRKLVEQTEGTWKFVPVEASKSKG